MALAVVALIVLLVLVLACAPASPADPVGPSRFDSLLLAAPDTEQSRASIVVIDVARIREQFSIGDPSEYGDVESYLDAFGEARAPVADPPWISGFRWLDESQESGAPNRNAAVGFDFRNVEQTAQIGQEPRYLSILRGTFSREAVFNAIDSCVACPVAPTVEEQNGVPIYKWGADFATSGDLQLQLPLFDRYGRGGRLAIVGELLFYAVYDEGMHALVDTLTQQHPTLGDRDEYTQLGWAMDELGAFSFTATSRTLSTDPDELAEPFLGSFLFVGDPDEWLKVVGQADPLLPYQAVAYGTGRDEQGTFAALALAHEHTESAVENVDRLRRRISSTTALTVDEPWADLLNAPEVWAEGPVLLAKLRTNGTRPASIAIASVLYGDPLLVHESTAG